MNRVKFTVIVYALGCLGAGMAAGALVSSLPGVLGIALVSWALLTFERMRAER